MASSLGQPTINDFVEKRFSTILVFEEITCRLINIIVQI